MTKTAVWERKRIARVMKDKGLRPLIPGGPMWRVPKAQFQALYACVGSDREALELQPVLVPWPPKDDEGNVHEPPAHWTYAWARAIDFGDEEVDPVIKDRMEKRIEAYYKHQSRLAVYEMGLTSRHLSRQAREGSLLAAKQVQMKYANDGVAMGLGAITQMYRAEAKTPTINFNGRLSLAPPKNSKRKATRKAEKKQAQITDAQWREVT